MDSCAPQHARARQVRIAFFEPAGCQARSYVKCGVWIPSLRIALAGAATRRGGTQSTDVLACPPPDCRLFPCRHYAFSHAGLAACGATAQDASVGSEWRLNLTAVRIGVAGVPAFAHATRTVRVVSPCATAQTHCPGLRPPCGSDPCVARSTLGDPAQPQVRQRVHLRFPDGVDGAGRSVVHATQACGLPAPLAIAPCTQPGPGCGVYAAAEHSAATGLRVQGSPALTGTVAQTACSLTAARRGLCGAGQVDFRYRALVNGTVASDAAIVHISAGAPLFALAVDVTTRLHVHPANESIVREAARFLQGGTHATNAALRNAAAHVATMVGRARCTTRGRVLVNGTDLGELAVDLRRDTSREAGVAIRSARTVGDLVEVCIGILYIQRCLVGCSLPPLNGA